MLKSRMGKWLVLFALAAAFSACGSDKKDGGGGSVVEGDAPELYVDPTEVMFVEVAIGTTDTQTITIQNVGKGDLTLTGIELVEETLDDSGQEFATGDDWINEITLATDEFFRLTVSYTPGDESPDHGYVEMRTNDPKYSSNNGRLRVPLRTPELAPRIFSRQQVTFRRVPPVTADTRDKFFEITEVQNIGQSPLVIEDIVVSPADGDFRISYPVASTAEEARLADPTTDNTTFQTTLQPEESFLVRVYFNPVDDLPSTGEMVFYSNDPQDPQYVVQLLGNSGAACMQLSHESEINFGEGSIGFANNRTIVIENCSSTSDLNVSEISVCTDVDGSCDASSPLFTINEASLPGELPTNPAVIGPQDTANFVLTYTPEDLSVSTGKLTVRSDDPAKSALVVPIVGKGTDNACPTAVAQAKVATSTRWETAIATIPLQTIDFRSESTDVDGTVDRYEWSIIQQPTNSTTRFSPSSTVAEPSLFLDLAGEYLIELKVFDNDGMESCGDQAIIHIVARPDEDIHVQLVWDTPADPDQTDTHGTDLDLHFLHPLGRWNQAPWDIFYFNKTNDWGPPGPEGDPSLDIDDVDGAGPENVNLNGPENLVYSVGVYYYADNGFGPSYGTIRVYIGGVQTYEYRDMFMAGAGTFWNAANISWPSGNVTATNLVRQGFPGN